MPDLDIKDLVWKVGITDTDGKIAAGIDQFDQVHIFIPFEELLSQFSVSANSGVDTSFAELMLRLGFQAGATAVLKEWVDVEDYYYVHDDIIGKYKLVKKEVVDE